MKDRLGKNLKTMRGNRTQLAVAKATGLGERTYIALEGGQNWPQYSNLQALAGYFDVHESQLFADPEMVIKAPKPSPAEALEIIKNALEKAESEQLTPAQRRVIPDLTALNDEQAAEALRAIQMIRETWVNRPVIAKTPQKKRQSE